MPYYTLDDAIGILRARGGSSYRIRVFAMGHLYSPRTRR